MFRSVFWRLVAAHVLVALLASTVAGTLSYRYFRRHYISAEEASVVRMGRALADLAAPLLDRGDAKGEVGTLARAAGAVVDGRVCIFGRTEHELLAASEEGQGAELDALPAITAVLEDQVRVERTSASCEPRHLLKVTVPINSARGRLGSVMVRAPVEGTESILRSVRRLTLLSAAGAGAVAFLLSLLVSRTIAGPLRRLTRMAGRIGEGDFAARVEPLPSGEIGYLAAAVNHMASQLQSQFDQLAEEKQVLIESAEQARRLEAMRRSFAANASHQLRTPLTGARGFVEALADGTAATPEARERCLAGAREQLGRMQTLIERLMDLSRFDSGAVELDREAAPIRGLLDAATAAFEPQLRAADVSIGMEIDPSLTPIEVDGARIVEALSNLLDNALRVSPRGGLLVLAARRDGEAVEFAVRDQGPGVAAADLDSVWERFFSRSPQGTGLGLAVVREIVLAHGGEVFARNLPEGGAEFGFRLPV
jgi:signal transduction histidine kinase